MQSRTETVHAGGCQGECGGWYVCEGCFRVVGWCFGAYDDLPDRCDDCWFAYHQAIEGPDSSEGANP